MRTGERIKARRMMFGISAETLAAMIGKSPATVYRYENGKIEGVDSEAIVPIADALKTTPNELLGWDYDEKHRQQMTRIGEKVAEARALIGRLAAVLGEIEAEAGLAGTREESE